MINFILIPLTVIGSVIAGVSAGFLLTQKQTDPLNQAKVSIVEHSPAPEPTYSFRPPTAALTFTVLSLEGSVSASLRGQENDVQASLSSTFVQGDAIKTWENSNLVASVSGYGFSLYEKSTLTFANLTPPALLLSLSGGSGEFETTNADVPLSVKVFTLLSEIKGKSTITTDYPWVSVSVASGSARLGIIDENNNTQIRELEENQQITINDLTKEIYPIERSE